ncbi:MAG: lysylphosphatidylglycerol synthase domain-containing protein, partial [archaeon]
MDAGVVKKGVIAAILLILLVLWVNPSRLIEQLHLVTLPVLLVMIGSVVIGQLINIFSQYVALQPIKPISLMKMLPHSLASWVSELFLPGKLGMFTLALFLQKEGIRLGESTSIILLLRLLGAALAFFLGTFAIGHFLNVQGVWSAFAAVFVVFIAIYVVFFTPKGRGFFKKYILGKYSLPFEGFSAGLSKVIRNRWTMLALMLLTIAYAVVQGIFNYWMFSLSGYELNIFTIITLLALVQILVQIPITINGLGIREGLLVLFFSSMGVPGEVTLVLVATNIAVAYIVALL